jgi:predicted kinase
MAGAPGSGKDYVMHKALAGHGLREINSDVPFEHSMKKAGLNPKMPESEQSQRDLLRVKAKHTTELKKKISLEGRNGVIINGTGDDHKKIKEVKDHLESLGYKTHMLFVHTDNETSRHRNIMRGKLGGREVPEEVRQEKWSGVHNAKKHYKDMFGSNFHEVDNSLDMTKATKEQKSSQLKKLDSLHKHFGNVVSSKEHTPEAQKWIDSKLKR